MPLDDDSSRAKTAEKIREVYSQYHEESTGDWLMDVIAVYRSEMLKTAKKAKKDDSDRKLLRFLEEKYAYYSHVELDLIEEALTQIDEGKTDTEINKSLGLSTYNLRKIRDNNNRPRSQQWASKQLSPEQINDIIDLITKGGTITQISAETGISKRKIKELRENEIRNGNTLPEFKKGVSRRQKYTDEELIELAFLNPGYGFKRFVEYLGISEFFVITLFLELKEFTDSEEDPLATLQDSSFVSWVTKTEYERVIGGPLPKGYGVETPLVPVPPINFNWGSFSPK